MLHHALQPVHVRGGGVLLVWVRWVVRVRVRVLEVRGLVALGRELLVR